jgi:hypothetical protein
MQLSTAVFAQLHDMYLGWRIASFDQTADQGARHVATTDECDLHF